PRGRFRRLTSVGRGLRSAGAAAPSGAPRRPSSPTVPLTERPAMSRRQSYEIPGIDHGAAPIPMAARVGASFQTSGIMGKDPSTNELPADGAQQVEFVFANSRTLLDI